MSVFVVGETGATHEGRFETMKVLIGKAAVAGCSAVKFQWTSSAAAMCERRHAPEYLGDYLKIQFPLEWMGELRAFATTLGLQFGCSVYLHGDPTLIAPFVDFIKVAAFEGDDSALLLEAYQVHSRVIVSDGMNDDAEKDWRQWSERRCYAPSDILHCCSCYPAPLSALNLSLCSGNGRHNGESGYSGFSDHSHDVRVGAWAVAAGAEIIETHMRLDDCDPANKDYAVSFTPTELAEYVRGIRDCEKAMGDGVKRIQDAEKEMLKFKVKS